MKEFVGGVLILAGLGTAGYAAWRWYSRSRGRPLDEGHPPLRRLAAAAALLLLIGSAISPEDRGSADGDGAPLAGTSTPTPSPTPTATPTPSDLLAQGERAVTEDDYATALSLVAASSAVDRSRVRRAVSRRLASRARAALRRNDRSAARRLLRQGRRYPRTDQYRTASRSLIAADGRAQQRAKEQRLARAQAKEARRLRAAARREANALRRAEEEAAEEPEESAGGGCDPGYDPCVPAFPPDVNCPDVDGPVTVTGDDPHGLDRDGDGTGCDS